NTQQQRLCYINYASSFVIREPLCLAHADAWGKLLQVNDRQLQSQLRGDNLHRLAVNCAETRPQNFVTPDDLIDCALDHRDVQIADDLQSHRGIIKWAAGFKLIQEPEPLLRKGDRQPPFSFRPFDLRTPRSAFPSQLLFDPCP